LIDNKKQQQSILPHHYIYHFIFMLCHYLKTKEY
jgi:hypothetical protein